MPYIPSPVWGVWFTDEQARIYYASDINTRIATLKFIGLDDSYVNVAVDQWVNETYGYMGAILNIPEIKNILTTAGKEGWSPERIQGAITQTAYWKSHTAAERNWLQLQSSDPEEARKQLQTAKDNLTTIALREGVSISQSRLDELATKVASGGITDSAAIQRMVVAEASYSPTASVGGIQAQASAIRARAQEFGIRLTEQGAFDWAKRIESGTADQGTVDEFLRQQAKARFANSPLVTQALEQGLTVRQAIDPQIAQVSELLEIDPDTVNITDAKFSPLVEYVDPDGNQRTMTTSEAAKWARGQNEYRTTAGANREAAALAENIAQRFGAVA